MKDYLYSKRQILKEGDSFEKKTLNWYIKEHESVGEWYLIRHKDILVKERNVNEWCSKWMPQSNHNILKWVIECSIYNALKYKFVTNKESGKPWMTDNEIDLFEDDEENDEDSIWL